ncbi:MATH domain and coiled-coil domain-containing protein At3g58400-like isoform X3 [Mangifera indica]|uniref:MATH domain and coiled-coil domain-containing protein At3g58400-like isoform X3 n=1 Tax=Mangifera indica TaxID=29780 RepID=UPI001CFBB02A|nr:MATH domain and coiled-coil domain-containing protein At3g58400-like isoform X3 [Mangifera indica]
MKLIGVTCISTIQQIAMDGIVADKDGIIRSTSDAPPTHYTVKIQLFSVLLKNVVEKYDSGVFEAGGYKWKLVLYPNGNKSKNVKEHISLYLAIADASSLTHGWQVYAVVRLFLLDQNKDNYLIVQDAPGRERHFHRLKLELGFDQYIPLTVFNDASNGYLVEDSCVFGAEVFVCKETITGKGECLSMIKDAPPVRHVWKVESFSKSNEECYRSKVSMAGDHKWKIQLYPKGRHHGTNTHLSLYLALANVSTLTPGSKIYVEFVLRIQDQLQGMHVSGKAKHWFSTSQREYGWPRFMSFIYLNNTSTGCLVKDVCVVEAEVTVLGISGAL